MAGLDTLVNRKKCAFCGQENLNWRTYCSKCRAWMVGPGSFKEPGMFTFTEKETTTTAPQGGIKYDNSKPMMELIAPEFLEGTADILTYGASKYSQRNWELGIRYGRVFGALMRHLWAWWRGNKVDNDTGKSHLWHASCCLMFLIAYEARDMGQEWDDREWEAEDVRWEE